MKCVLIDLERSIRTGVVYYWKKNRFGYTTNLQEAGWFEEAEADAIVQEDVHKTTVKVSEQTVQFVM